LPISFPQTQVETDEATPCSLNSGEPLTIRLDGVKERDKSKENAMVELSDESQTGKLGTLTTSNR